MVKHLEPIVYNDTLKEFNTKVPNMLKLVNATSEVLNRAVMQTVIKNDTFVEDTFTNVTKAKEIIISGNIFNNSNIEDLLDSRIILGMVTGDLISVLPFKTVTSSLLFPFASQNELKIIQMIMQNGSATNMSYLRKQMTSNIDWHLLIDEYKKFKLNNNELTSFSKFVSDSLDSVTGKRRKRQTENTNTTTGISTFMNMTEIEDMIRIMRLMNLTQYTDMMIGLADEMNSVIEEFQTIAVFMESGSIEDIDTMMTLILTSPQLARISESVVKMLDQLEPFFNNTEYYDMYQGMKGSFKELNQYFAKTSTNLQLSKVVKNWEDLKLYMSEEAIFNGEDIQNLGETLLSSQLIFTLFLRIEEFDCVKDITRYIEFFENQEFMINSTCDFLQTEKMIELLGVIDMDSAAGFIFSVMELSPNGLAANSNMTVDELQTTLDSISKATEIMPIVDESLGELMNQLNVTNFNITTISNLICGLEIVVPEINYKVCVEKYIVNYVISINLFQPLTPAVNESNPNIAPLEDGCKVVKNALFSTWDGKIIWTMMENIFRYMLKWFYSSLVTCNAYFQRPDILYS